MTDIKAILNKGKLTGEEVGRLFLRDYTRFLKAVLLNEEAPPQEKFTEAEKQIIVNGVKEPYEIKQYNTFIGIIQFLQKTAIVYSEQYRQIKYLLSSLLVEIEQAKQIDIIRLLRADAPLLLTEPQYKRLKTEDLEKKLAKKTSVGGIILTATEYYLKTYLEGENTPYNGLFKAYKGKPLTNPEFKRNYWEEGVNGHYETPDGKRSDKLKDQDWVKELVKWHTKEMNEGKNYVKWVEDGRQAPPEATKHDILEYLGNYLNIGEKTTGKELETFKNDYPDIYEAILKEIKGIKGLELPKDYHNPEISYKTLYNLGLPYYQEFFRFNPKDGDSFIASFISIIPEEELKHWTTFKTETYLDKDGNYKYRLSEHEKKQISEWLPNTIKQVGQHLKQIFALQEIYRLLGEQLEEDCISELANDKSFTFTHTYAEGFTAKAKEGTDEEGKTFLTAVKEHINNIGFLYWLIEVINQSIEHFKKQLRKTSLIIDPETIKEIHEAVKALPIIDIKTLKPKKEAILKVKELTKDLNYYGQKGLNLYDILTE